MARITFCGAAREVTGSRHLIEAAGRRILLDCGQFQGHRREADAKNRKFLFDPKTVDAVILSHAHMDHGGNIPLLVKLGFGGNVFCSPATADLVMILLEDSAKLQEKDVEFFNKKNPKNRISPVYSSSDVQQCYGIVKGVEMDKWFEPAPGIQARLTEAGHILGSCQIELAWQENGVRKTLLFTGDLGRKNMALLNDPAIPSGSPDMLLLETTYGNRLHAPLEGADKRLAQALIDTAARGGKVIIPAFAVGRVQEVASTVERLHLECKIPNMPVYVDSPLAEKATAIFSKHRELLDEDFHKLAKKSDPFGKGWVHYVASQKESMKLNEMRVPMVIISPSGMCEGGRVLHHLRNSLGRHENLVLIVGFQAEGTLGRALVEGRTEVPIYGMPINVKARVQVLNEYSAHADKNELLTYVKSFKTLPKHIALVHGERLAQGEFEQVLKTEVNASVSCPEMGTSLEF